MTAVAFDAFKLAQSLRAKNSFTVQQAEDLVSSLSDAVQSDIATGSEIKLAKDQLSSNLELAKTQLSNDLERLKTQLSTDLELAKTQLSKTIAETKVEIMKWMFGAIGFQTLVIVGAILSLNHR